MSASPFIPHPLAADPGYLRLKEYVIASTGLAYYGDKDPDLAVRLAQRQARVGKTDCASYLALLEDDAKGHAELDALIEDLTIGETFFFRHRELFNAIRDSVLPDLIARNRNTRQLRIWSAGCSTGAEPYSLAIVLRHDLGASIAGWDISIVCTDVNREFLARAREGVFESWALRNTPEDAKHAYFTRAGSSWRIKPEYKEGVSFQYHNLVTHPFPSLVNNLFAFDLILCRNVTIYFSAEIVRRIVGHFNLSLVEGGWLLVGHSEPNIELFRCFRTVNAPGAVLYQKTKETPPPGWFDLGSVAGAEALRSPGVERPQCGASAGASQSLSPGHPHYSSSAWVPPLLPDLQETTGLTSAASPPPASAPAVPRGRDELDAIRRLADRGEWLQATATCQRLLDRDRLNPAVHFYQALVLEQTGRHAEAEQALRRVIYLDRTFVLGHYYLGLLLQKKGQLAQAARSFKNVLQLLERMSPETVFADGDGITPGELGKITQMHLEVLEWE